MTDLICIQCPRGCLLKAEQREGLVTVRGNGCKRGEAFAKEELVRPMRTVCSTVKTTLPGIPVLPVRTAGEVPKGRMLDVMREINRALVTVPAHTGDAVIRNVLGLGVDVIATADAP